MPGLLRGIARTAAVAGTATVVAGRVQRHQASKFAQRDAETAAQRDQAYDEQVAPQEYAQPPQDAAPPPAPAADPLERLKTLGELKESGVLTEAEFQAQKAKILAG
ncbi:SHOCT domain-containing protein [Kribbella qitaiheensis]|uniref:SHOCT domain-containing protein n=1 Tax=Kribbella qitaiheensis TaxID=1544730 RepID=UPI00361C7972